MRRLLLLVVACAVAGFGLLGATVRTARADRGFGFECVDSSPYCADVYDSIGYNGAYTGHDEPSTLFYSNTAGSGDNQSYHLTLPKEPPTLPKQDGSGGTWNFQLHPAFWFGMAMCDTQSYPLYTSTCTPDSDTNIKDDSNPSSPNYIGKHAGTAFMEMQFYPPGWAPFQLPGGISCDATKWCAALTIDSLSENPATGQVLNPTCQAITGLEYVNFAFITHDGVAQAPANPVHSTAATFTPDASKDLFMNGGDNIDVNMHDTASGLQVALNDTTTHESGSMTASAANSFGQVQFDPTGTSCNNIPYDFHPMYSTSSEHTRVPWAAHSYNVAFSDEIGHFDYCNDPTVGFSCTTTEGVDGESADGDDAFCLDKSVSLNVQVSGCALTNDGFDGTPYQLTWPGTAGTQAQDAALHPTPIQFSSPQFNNNRNFDRVAFETDLPRIEVPAPDNPFLNCNRNTGAGCTNPPTTDDGNPAVFYPFFSTATVKGHCVWQEGGAGMPGTTNSFGGSAATEFGPLLQLVYEGFGTGLPITRYNNFRQVLSSNPCTSHG
jgi:hypothetical protein